MVIKAVDKTKDKHTQLQIIEQSEVHLAVDAKVMPTGLARGTIVDIIKTGNEMILLVKFGHSQSNSIILSIHKLYPSVDTKTSAKQSC